jgi:hypothetical protein
MEGNHKSSIDIVKRILYYHAEKCISIMLPIVRLQTNVDSNDSGRHDFAGDELSRPSMWKASASATELKVGGQRKTLEIEHHQMEGEKNRTVGRRQATMKWRVTKRRLARWRVMEGNRTVCEGPILVPPLAHGWND